MLDMTDGEFERRGAELRAAHAQTKHELEMAKAEGLNAINTIRYDNEILAAARDIHKQDPAGPSVDAIIERVVIPIREAYLARFESNTAPVHEHRAGPNEEAFNKLLGETNE